MKKHLVAAISLASAVSLAVLAPGAIAGDFESGKNGKAVWNDVPTGFALAKKQGKPIVTDFYTDWCGWCKKMERTTFEHPDVLKIMNEKFVMVRANAEDGGSGEKLARRMNLQGYPTTVIFDASGAPKVTIVGYRAAQPFAARLNAYLDGKTTRTDE